MNKGRLADPTPFHLEGNHAGVLLIHGFTGSPAEMRLIGEYLHERGLTVSAPLLPGHGTTPEDLNRQRWQDWYRCVEEAFGELSAACDPVFIGGLSLGAVLTLRLAAEHAALSGAVAYSPAVMTADKRSFLLPIVKHLIDQVPKPHLFLSDASADERLWYYDVYPTKAAHEVLKLASRTKRQLRRIDCPLLIIYSTDDEAIHPDSAQFTYRKAGTEEKEIVALENCGHALTVDRQWEEVAERTYTFIES
ncbi:MAG: alpha/beta hydrolase, partial [Anaerolineae bacterium]